MPNFYTDIIRKSLPYTCKTKVSTLDLLEPVTRKAVLAIVADAKALGVDLMVFETYRSQERQQQLFAAGATRLRNVGVHHYGLAADLVRLAGGQPTWKGDYSFLEPLAKKHGLIWGGSWKTFQDSDHFQRCAVDDQSKLFSGTWYPDDSYNPYSAVE